jgi:hypothetical protein
MFCFIRVAMQTVKRVEVFLAMFWPSPELYCIMALPSLYSCCWKHCIVGFVSPINLNGSLYMCLVGHGLCSGILSTMFLRVCFSRYPLEVVDCYVLVTLTVKFLG